MYFGHISNYNPVQYPKVIQLALDYLKNTDFDAMEAGVYELKGRQIYVQVLDLDTKEKSAYQPEVHQHYLDVQYLHKGVELMAAAIDLGNNPVAKEYDVERDIKFYSAVQNENEFRCKPGNFAIFFPEDTHRTAIFAGEAKIRKVVVKIAISEL
ncbi:MULTISPECIES: YhcH/YjgK/YiaL family protein [Mannheimia]|uniref:YhcH/YjgK/YiaL family protein n=1 Tax=Mannheimia pernigra TaxID=111844 RepID=A0A7H8UTF9_9PAST|nr:MULTISPECIES: YhcH/YjgK/YiaL family protein [Mannheimia]QLB39686.1 YhcH/YjgK/YiaL family protein [Mannheimia pernigra]QLB43932.1 YhcH/YjgK/YiaL family protein [Mannheimia pernigra]QTM00951.1 YhcH/YjgK/YiaL family protein [Mannheimia sp. ZY171111]